MYGEPGIGKTVLAGSADSVPEMRPVLLIDMEGGTESLRHTYSDVQVVRVKTWKETYKLYELLCDTDHGYQTVIIDSLSEVQKFDMNNIMADVAANNSKMIEEVPSQREYLISLEHMRKFIRGFRDLEINTIFTSLAAKDKDTKTGKFLFSPMLTGKLSSEVAGFLDEVFYMYMKENIVDGEEVQQRLLLTGKTETTIAKDRSGLLPQVIVDPTMQKIYKMMTNNND